MSNNLATKTRNIDLKEILLQGAKVWNRWREDHPDFFIDLKEIDLSHADLAQVNLNYADLTQAELSYADLTQAELSYAKLRYADLTQANLSQAILVKAQLFEAQSFDTNFSQANLRYANLRYADLRYANFSYADLSQANLRQANLCYANFRYADLSQADLRQVDLCQTNLSDADLRYAKLFGTDFEEIGVTKTVDVEVNILDEKIEDETIENLESGISKFIALQGYESPEVIYEERGSLFKKLRFKIATFISPEQQEKAYEQAKKDINEAYSRGKDYARGLSEKPGTEATQQISEATAKIIESLKDVNNAAIRLGKLVVVKTTDVNGKSYIMAETISQEFQNRLDSDPHFLKNPQAVADFLQDTGAALKIDA